MTRAPRGPSSKPPGVGIASREFTESTVFADPEERNRVVPSHQPARPRSASDDRLQRCAVHKLPVSCLSTCRADAGLSGILPTPVRLPAIPPRLTRPAQLTNFPFFIRKFFLSQYHARSYSTVDQNFVSRATSIPPDLLPPCISGRATRPHWPRCIRKLQGTATTTSTPVIVGRCDRESA